jgi:cellulose synthase/poly-beta-1,6-N-acetylglucosamine synthase-like glycosyltransferase
VWRISWVKQLSKNLPLRGWFSFIGTKTLLIPILLCYLVICAAFFLIWFSNLAAFDSRRATPRNDKSKYGDRAIHIKQFRHIPMADMELVLVWLLYSLKWTNSRWILHLSYLTDPLLWFKQPEKKNPGLTPMDWTKLMVSAGIGLVNNPSHYKLHCMY